MGHNNMTKLATSLIAPVILIVPLSLEASEYTVRPNDTLSQIAKSQFGSSSRWKEIAKLNNLKPPYKLSIGQRLILPDVSSTPGVGESVEVELIPRAPASGSEFTQTELQVNKPGASFELPARLWICVFVALVLFWVFSVICLRAGCWFSLVEASFMRCALLSLVSAGLLLLFLGVLASVGYLVVNQHMSPSVFPVAGVVLFVVYLVVSNILTKRILACKWRSVLTVSVMTGVVANLLTLAFTVVLLIALPSVMATESLKAFFTAIMHAT
jgi:hypothetical protein